MNKSADLLTFKCNNCGKVLEELTLEIFKKAYDGHNECLTCRSETKTIKEEKK